MKMRWIKQSTMSAEALKVQMPWERGTRRAQMIARREARMSRLNLLTA
ncbi:hypothetical protein [Oceanicola sp. D3]|nr:hypothetical protein [Oceanicola sp. D3]